MGKRAVAASGIYFFGFQGKLYFCKPCQDGGCVIFAALKEKDIYVRYFNKPRIDNFLRITIGTKEEMERLFAALEEILQQV